MKVYTSYYSKISRNPRGLVPVRVSTSAPSWFPFELEEIPELYPGWDLVSGIKNGSLDKEAYERIYRDKLKRLDKDHIIQVLNDISQRHQGRDLVLLCYEKTGDFCHRPFIAEWLGDITELE